MSQEYRAALAAVLANRDTVYRAPWSKALERMTDEHNAICVELSPTLGDEQLIEIKAMADALALRLKEKR